MQLVVIFVLELNDVSLIGSLLFEHHTAFARIIADNDHIIFFKVKRSDDVILGAIN